MKQLEINRDAILKEVIAHPYLSYAEIGKRYGVCAQTVNNIARKAGITRRPGRKMRVENRPEMV